MSRAAGSDDGDRRHMRLALRLAARGRGRTSPNPMVGAVLVRDGHVVGAGYHHAVGRPHAEIEALREAGEAARGATLYVSLEPCCHYGRTGPCSRAVIAAGVSRVVAAMQDPNPLVAGQGFAEIRAAGITVECGVLEDEARALNAGFLSLVEAGRPHVTLKLAATLDGRIAARGGDARWISSPESRRFVHHMRTEVDAVAVGAGTARTDDPQLTARTESGGLRRRQPARVVVDPSLSLPPTVRLLAEPGGGPVWLVAAADASPDREAELVRAGARVLRVARTADGGLDLGAALAALGREGIASLLVEGGRVLGTALLRARLVDTLALFLAPKIMGGDGSVGVFGWLGVERAAEALLLVDRRVRHVGPDLLVTGRPIPAPATGG